MRDVWRRSRAEFLLILATALAILALPIEQGVSVGVLLSVLHGVWTTTRAQAVEFERIPGTSIWWPRDKDSKGEFVSGVRVIALQAPLSFLNAYNFRRAIARFVNEGAPIRLIVIEANALVEIDYTGATVLAELVGRLRGRGRRRRGRAARIRARAAKLRAARIVRADRPRPCFPQRAGGDRRAGRIARGLMHSSEPRFCRRSNSAIVYRKPLDRRAGARTLLVDVARRGADACAA